ncbi:MAG: undecaprenyl-diphosphate phosphatase [candidate division WOR-3 bacterium]|nr:MAG: undecaprenyl-diphosphate phosphatase [candidate division WOR-3 bacterium]
MILHVIILGVVQGLTEFLPISSSGHLAILEGFFGITEPVALTAFLHLGTLLATIVFFFKKISSLIRGLIKGKRESISYTINIIIGSIPIVIFALVFKSWIETSFTDFTLVTILLGVTGIVLLVTGVMRKQEMKVSYLRALVIGIAQMFAALPGLSRSGLTISAGLFSGVSPEESFTFSFLLSLPAILGANLVELANISTIDKPTTMIIGLVCSFIFGLIALRILRDMVRRRFHLFGIYCLVISLIVLLLS